jgi:sn-glycerol 3-phosphate transport system permease protein
VLPTIAAANIWLFIYTPDYGLLDKLLYVFHIATPILIWLATRILP